MNNQIINNRLSQYQYNSKQEELNAIKEIMQEIVLAALSRTDFFKQAAFQGGTCLRIIYGLNRFSEDLDFILLKKDLDFSWSRFLSQIQVEFKSYGLNLEVKERVNIENPIKKAFVKEDSFGQLLTLYFPRNVSDAQKIEIKLEIDTHPPQLSKVEVQYLDFPYPCSILVQDKPSLFSGKCHALLCRNYLKGRDWYDYIWYITQKIPIDYVFLKSALHQSGPWHGQSIIVNKDWIIKALQDVINVIDLNKAKLDVLRFVKPNEVYSLDLWNKDFFLAFTEKLNQYLP